MSETSRSFGNDVMSERTMEIWAQERRVTPLDRLNASMNFRPGMDEAAKTALIEAERDKRARLWYETHIGMGNWGE